MKRNQNALDASSVNPDPVIQFGDWYKDAIAADLMEPDAMTLATSSLNGIPSIRIVLLKDFDSRGFVFYTNYESRKGKELAENQCASLLFYWPDFDRQVRIEGTVQKITPEESEHYFRSRPRGHQISAAISVQSEIITSRAELEARFAELEKKYQNKEIPRPLNWGGFRLKPHKIEFWQGRENRLHDRILYTLQDNGSWLIQRLSP